MTSHKRVVPRWMSHDHTYDDFQMFATVLTVAVQEGLSVTRVVKLFNQRQMGCQLIARLARTFVPNLCWIPIS